MPLGGCADGRSATSEPATTDTTAEASTSAASTVPVSTGPPSTTPPSTSTTTTSTTVAPTTTNRLGTVSFTGHGDELIDLGPGNDRFIVRAVHTGRGAFSISARNEAFETVAIPIFGRAGRLYFGSQVIGAEPSQIRYLEVTADGDWNVEMLTTSMLSTVTMPFESGTRDQAVMYEGEGGNVRITHDGDAAFIVVVGELAVREIIVNEVGPYDAVHQWPSGPILVNIAANGHWSVSFEDG